MTTCEELLERKYRLLFCLISNGGYLKMTGRIYIGTSGWHYAHWKGPFYPENITAQQMLNFYTRHFRVVEINNSFYQLPASETLDTWRTTVPENFIFAVKASRYITHMKKLKDPRETVHKFLHDISTLGNKLGPILFQLPPRWKCNPDRLTEFLTVLPGGLRYAFEFRDPSWFSDKVYSALKQANAAFCIYDLDGTLSPVKVTADFTYIRLHGPEGAYQGCYTQSTLAQWAETLAAWGDEGKDVFCFFDNDQEGYAVENAQSLKELLQQGD